MDLRKTDWDKWLIDFRERAISMGYIEYPRENLKNQSYTFWKQKRDKNGTLMYAVGMLLYDFRKLGYVPIQAIGVQHECVVLETQANINLSVSDEYSIEEFEQMCESFYESMKKHIKSY